MLPALESVSRDLPLEVQRTFDYFASAAEHERIGKIVLSGGCARLAGVDEFPSPSWRIPAELGAGDPLRPLVRGGGGSCRRLVVDARLGGAGPEPPDRREPEGDHPAEAGDRRGTALQAGGGGARGPGPR